MIKEIDFLIKKLIHKYLFLSSNCQCGKKGSSLLPMATINRNGKGYFSRTHKDKRIMLYFYLLLFLFFFFSYLLLSLDTMSTHYVGIHLSFFIAQFFDLELVLTVRCVILFNY